MVSCRQEMGSSKVTHKKRMGNNIETCNQGMVNMLVMRCWHVLHSSKECKMMKECIMVSCRHKMESSKETHKKMGYNKEICKLEMVNMLLMGRTQAFDSKMARQLTMECELIFYIQVMVNMLEKEYIHSFCHKMTMECRLAMECILVSCK